MTESEIYFTVLKGVSHGREKTRCYSKIEQVHQGEAEHVPVCVLSLHKHHFD